MSAARTRLVDTATRLFYGEGVHTVGIDRIIADAGVAKATFYHHFKAKDELVVAYLTAEYDRQRALFTALPGSGTERLRTLFELFGEYSCGPTFRGCPFLNAAAEFADPAHPVRRVVDDYRTWLRTFFLGMLEESGRADAQQKADFLLVARDGIAVSGGLGDTAAVRAGVAIAMAAV